MARATWTSAALCVAVGLTQSCRSTVTAFTSMAVAPSGSASTLGSRGSSRWCRNSGRQSARRSSAHVRNAMEAKEGNDRGEEVAESMSTVLPRQLYAGRTDPKEWFESMTKAGHDTEMLVDLNDLGKKLLESTPMPHRKWEPFRYADLESLFRTEYVSPGLEKSSAKPPTTLLEQMAAMKVEACAGQQVVFVDGLFSEELSDVSALPADAYLGSIRGLSGDKLESVKAQLEYLPESEDGLDKNTVQGSLPFAALNQACMEDVAVLSVDDFATLDTPVQFMFLSSEGAEQPLVSNPRLVISMGQNSTASVFQTYSGLGKYFTNGLSSATLGSGATLNHFYLQEASLEAQMFDTMHVACEEDSVYDIVGVCMGANQGRLNLQVEHPGTRSRSSVQLLALTHLSQLIDCHTSIGHTATNTNSFQVQRNVVTDRSECVFKGRIRVDEEGAKTDSDQICRTLLLSSKARITCMPSLEIINSDVKCAHGATVTDLDEESLFYLESRGVKREDAKALVMRGFVFDIVKLVPCPKLLQRVTDRVLTMTPKVDREVKGVFSSI